MGKFSSRLRTPKRTSSHVDGAIIDRWFARASHLSQVLLVLLGGFGYFYTVLPLYQKALLDEDIAQRTLELREKERQVAVLASQIGSRTNELRQKDQQIERAETLAVVAQGARQRAQETAVAASNEARAAQQAKALAENQAQTALVEANSRYLALRQEIITTYSGRVRYCLLNAGISDTLELGLFRSCIAQHLKSAPAALVQLNPSDRDKYLSVARRLLDEMDPRFAEYVQRVNRRKQEAAYERSAEGRRHREALREPGDRAKDQVIVGAVSTDSILASIEKEQEGYQLILDEYIKRLRAEVLATSP